MTGRFLVRNFGFKLFWGWCNAGFFRFVSFACLIGVDLVVWVCTDEWVWVWLVWGCFAGFLFCLVVGLSF